MMNNLHLDIDIVKVAEVVVVKKVVKEGVMVNSQSCVRGNSNKILQKLPMLRYCFRPLQDYNKKKFYLQ